MEQDQSNANYDVGNTTIYNTEVLKSNLCDCNEDYLLVRGDITVPPAPATEVSFKNCAPFTKCNNKSCQRFRFSHANVQLNRIMFKLF